VIWDKMCEMVAKLLENVNGVEFIVWSILAGTKKVFITAVKLNIEKE